MKNRDLALSDIYTVINHAILNDQDRSVLTKLYKPIIGSDAISLYYSLWSDLEKNGMSKEHTFNHLTLATQLTIKEIKDAKNRLEGTGLIKTYLKTEKQNYFVFQIYNPLTASDFFKNILLSSALYSILGKTEYKVIKADFTIPKFNIESYEDVSKAFDQIFTAYHPKSEPGKDNIEVAQSINPSVKENLDFELLSDSLPTPKMINKEIRELLSNLSYVYNMSSMELKPILLDSIEKGAVNQEKIRKKCKKYYEFENNDKPKFIYQEETKKTELNPDSKRDKMISVFENTSPYQFLRSKYKNGKPTARDLEVIEALMTEQKLTPSVTNVLIDYVLKINQNRLTKKFVEAIASQWKISNVSTAAEAMKLAESTHKKKKTLTAAKTTKTPNWFNDKLKKEETSESEQKELEAMMKEFK